MQAHNTRFATPADIDQICRLARLHAEYEKASLSITRDELAGILFEHGDGIRCLVAEIQGEVVGYATFTRQLSTWLACSYLFLDTLYLLESARGQGLGRVMMERIRHEARRRGCQHIEWQTPEFNVDAIGFYTRLGATSLTKERFTWGVGADASIEADPTSSQPTSIREPYLARPTAMTGIRDCRGWRLKLYEITLDGTPIDAAVIDAALAYAKDQVIWPAEATDRVGFLILHRGKHSMWALVHLWVDDILRHFVFLAPLSEPTKFDVSPMPGFNACVWELEVTRHERDAWVKHVMSTPDEPQLERYLRDGLAIA